MKKAYQHHEDVPASYGKYTSSIGKVSQSFVESSIGSLNRYHSQCVKSTNS